MRIIGVATSEPYDSRNASIGGMSTKYANAAPAAKHTSAAGVIDIRYAFSRRVSPGDTNATTWYVSTGSASTSPPSTATLTVTPSSSVTSV